MSSVEGKTEGRDGGRATACDLRRLQEADVVVLNEVDWGLKRTGYRNVAAELASALRMNYAYGVEFIATSICRRGRKWTRESTS